MPSGDERLVIRPVSGRRDLARFIDVPWKVYDRAHHPDWVAPLRAQVRGALDPKAPMWERMERELFLAERDGAPVGRIAAIRNDAHNEYHGDRLGFFGFFECRDDAEAARALVDAAAAWLEGRGLQGMRGPVSPSTNYETGLLVDGFEHPPQFLTPWNAPYYGALLEGAGLEPVKDLLGFALPLDRMVFPPELLAQAERATSRHRVTVRPADWSVYDDEVERIWQIYHSAWEPNWGFVPMSKREFLALGRELKPLLIPRLIHFAEMDGEAVGFILSFPDYNRILRKNPGGRLFPFGLLKLLLGKSRLDTGRVMALGVKPAVRRRGVLPLVVQNLMTHARDLGFHTAEASWILDDNRLMVATLERMGLERNRRWRLYQGPTGGVSSGAPPT